MWTHLISAVQRHRYNIHLVLYSGDVFCYLNLIWNRNWETSWGLFYVWATATGIVRSRMREYQDEVPGSISAVVRWMQMYKSPDLILKRWNLQVLHSCAISLAIQLPDRWMSKGTIPPPHTLNTIQSEVQLNCDSKKVPQSLTQCNYESIWLNTLRAMLLESSRLMNSINE